MTVPSAAPGGEEEAADRGPVALDAYGADGGPELVLEGARIAVDRGAGVRLFGPLALGGSPGIEIETTESWISNEAEPVAAVRADPEASVDKARI